MLHFDIYDVKGDGNCYYRCIWNIAKHSYLMKSALGIEDCMCEIDGVNRIRMNVATYLKHTTSAQQHLQNVWELVQEVEDVDEEYPIANVVRSFTTFDDKVVQVAAEQIANTSIMASALEHSIVQAMLPCIQFIVVSTTGRKQTFTKWMRCLTKQLEHSTKKYVAVLVNVNNIHYKYVKINGMNVATRESIIQQSRGKQ